jgi:beta-ureidopropionase / N-carbamoyl-L-amino-acid hydrolase
MPLPLAIDRSRLLQDLHDLARIGRQPSGGITRRTYTREYAEAVDWLIRRMGEAGLSPRVDAVGNVIGRLGAPGKPAVLCGSHIDTVPDGGWLDGSYGVLAGVECARVLQETSTAAARALEVAAFVDEEGAFLSLLGSRAMAGTLSASELESARSATGVRLHDQMRQAGLDPDAFEAAMRIDEDIVGYVELHIEQGPVLEHQRKQIGIVEGIAGILLTEYDFTGSADHAGTTPPEMRRDAFRGAAEFVAETYERMEGSSAPHCRMTFGAVDVQPGASNVIPRQARITQEIRGLRRQDIEHAFALSSAAAEEAAARRGLAVEVRKLGWDQPAVMSEDVLCAVRESCDERGVSWLRMLSGAGHDAQSFAERWPTGMIFVPSRRGASHRPDEQTDEADLGRGANVLLATLGRLLVGDLRNSKERQRTT